MNVQERLQLKRIPLDNWSTREQLFLAMAVLCSGDQNWMSVSRALKMMCGSNRPTDWFSQKFCAAQYGKLLENVEPQKRKKRTVTERDSSSSTDTIVPGEVIVRKLVQERNAELKKIVEEEQREYRQLVNEIQMLQNDSLDDAQVLAMWEQIENENREKEKELQKHAQWLKEREEKKIEMERAWRPGVVSAYQNANSMSPTSNSNSSGSPSRNSPLLTLKMASAIVKVEQLGDTIMAGPVDQLGDSIMAGPDTPVKQGTSPLLTSLLKSPSSTPSTPTQTQQVVSSRSLAPTITNLLTGGQQAINTSSPAITLNVANPGQSFFNFHSPHPQHQQTGGVATTPSKAAPTLSKLLDPSRKVESTTTGMSVGQVALAPEEDAINIDEDQQLMEVFKELMPEDLADILTDNNEMIVSPELLDQDLEHASELIQGNAGVPTGPAQPSSAVTTLASSSAIVEQKKDNGPVANKGAAAEGQPTIVDNLNSIPASKNDLGKEILQDFAGESSTSSGLPATEKELADATEHTVNIGDDSVPIKFEPEIEGEQHEHFPSDVTPEVDLQQQLASSANDDGASLKEEPDLDNTEATAHNAGLDADEEQKGDETANCEVADAGECQVEDEIEDETKVAPEEDHEKYTATIEAEHTSPEAPAEAMESDIASEENPQIDETAQPQEPSSLPNTAEPEVSHPIVAEAVPTEVEATKVAERKVSTDNEDHFEDAKSSVDDSGNPPEEVEISVPAKEVPEAAREEKLKSHSSEALSHSEASLSDHRSSRSKRDMPRRNRSQTGVALDEKHGQGTPTLDKRHLEDSGEETKSSSASNLSLRTRLKDRDRSESPLVMDEDTNDVIPRTRRRYSSTPVIDSVPSSPASGDDREYKNWKKALLIAYNQFSTLHYKYSAVLVQQVPEEFRHIILRPMDMQTIKKNIETGVIKTTMEFQRDVLLMVQNAIMMNTRRDRDWTNLINDMMVEVDYWKRETEKNLNSRESDNSTGGSSRDGQNKVRNRKSMRITAS